MKVLISLFVLMCLFSHNVAFAEIPKEGNLSAYQQEKYKKQMDNLYDDVEIKLSTLMQETQIKKIQIIQSKIRNVLEKNISDKTYFSLLYLNTLLDEKIDILEQNQKRFLDGDTVALIHTNKGVIKIKLFYEQAPKTVFNFIALSQKGYYNNLVFHRVIKDFMIQGGDPLGTGMGGESIYGGEFEDEFHSELKNVRGTLSMANAGKNTNGSQFFINQKDNNFLDNRHTVFGEVIEGMEFVDKIANIEVNGSGKPMKDIKIIKIEIKTFQNSTLKNKKIDFDTELKKIKDDEYKKAKLKQEINKNRVVKAGDKIKVHYIGTLAKNSEKFDSSYDRNSPIEFEVGAKMMIEGFDRGVLGMKVGDKKVIKISAKDAYGERDPSNINEIPKSQLNEFEKTGIKLEVGELIPTIYGQFPIVKVSKDTVSVDMNHFLAGEDLAFEVELLEFID